MNTSTTKAREAARFEYGGWLVVVALAETSDSTISGHAYLHYEGIHRCTIALTNPHHSWESATHTLTHMAQAFVDGWKTRDHLGDTGFCDL